MHFKVLEEDVFANFVQHRNDVHAWQTTSMAHLKIRNGWNVVYVGVEKQGILCAAAMISYCNIFFSYRYAQALRGFYIDYKDTALLTYFHQQLMQYLKQIGCISFQMDPYLIYKQRDGSGELVAQGEDNSDVLKTLQSLGYHHHGFVVGMSVEKEPNWMYVKDIKGKNATQLLQEFDQQTRWSIQRALKSGIEICELHKQDLPVFKKIMDHTAQRRGFKDHSMHYYENLLDTFGKDQNLKLLMASLNLEAYEKQLQAEKAQSLKQLQEIEQLLQETPKSKKYHKKRKVLLETLSGIAKKESEIPALRKDANDGLLPLAVATFLTAGKEILYLYSGAYDKYLKFHASYALQWYMMQYGIAHGYERYNFYGISGIFDKKDEGYGVYAFKKGFHGHVEQLIGEWEYVIHPTMHRCYQTLRQIKKIVRGC